jgi:hypothetical protein
MIKNTIALSYYENWQEIYAEFVLARDRFIESSKENTPFNRLVSFFYQELFQIVEHPIYTLKGVGKWKYTCFEDKEDVAEIVLLAFRKVIFDVAEDVNTISDRPLNAIRSTIYLRTRHRATPEIYRNLQIPIHPKSGKNGEIYYERKIEYMSDNRLFELIAQFYNNGSQKLIKREKKIVYDPEGEGNSSYETPEGLIIKKETDKIIKDTITKFLQNKDKLDTAIFLNHIMAKAHYDRFRFDKFSPEQIASMNDVHVRTVFKRQKKLLGEFKEVWAKEIQPYLAS